MSVKMIKDIWANKGIWSANYGTWIHHNIERYINGLVSQARPSHGITPI